METDSPVDLFEFVIDPVHGAVPKRVRISERGLVGKYFMALSDGFLARFGGTLTFFDETNETDIEIGATNDEALVFSILGVEIVRLEKKKLKTPCLEVGEPGESWIELYAGDEKVYLSVTPSRKISIRKTPPRRTT